ncbi:cytotoxic and regulatory T cell molecule [Columba livia]|uniref:Cytotoxic and regulatory T cell molecule n=1 Tax=Columba livia TaxID=8932 RepID=A0A2I0LS71_COLLI|nr:cytotoxic and regulatory T cell molecule [Columba livia]
MTFTRVLHVVALFLMQGDFPGAGSETITLKEGEDLNLRCTLSSDGSSARQWLNPHDFSIFLDTHRALRDRRYKLIHYSKEELSIQLSNVTVHDAGVYKCFYYGTPFKSKNKTVEVLAAPSNPVLEVSRDTESSITLSCYTHGCKPQPQVTWLLDNGIELPGDTKHKLEADGKKWTTTSRLTVLAYGPGSTASCIVRHQALKEELMASFHFEDIPRTVTNTDPAPAALEVNTHATENEQSPVTAAESDLNSSTVSAPSYPQHNVTNTDPAPAALEVNTHATENEQSPVTAAESDLNSSTVSAPSYPQHNVTNTDLAPGAVNTHATENEQSAVTAAESDLNSSTASAPSYPQHNGSEQLTIPSTVPEDPKCYILISIPPGAETSFNGNVTEEEISTPDTSPTENVTVISTITFEQNVQPEGMETKENNLLLPILVAALIFVLLIIVLLFMRKLKRAHGVWKRENDVSDQTVESFKSKSNEDSPGHEKNGHVVNQKSNMQYVTDGYAETMQKNPRDTNIAISEKLFGCGRETNV